MLKCVMYNFALLCREGCPVSPGSALQKVLYLTPTLSSNMDRRGVALDGHLKNIHTNLASSTL